MSEAERPRIWSISYVALLISVALSAVLVGYYLHVVFPFVMLPADILMFSESDFIGSIIKLRADAPLYTPPQDNNTLVYTPGAPVLTYFIAWLIDQPTSIPILRAIQLAFVTCTALLATSCCRWLNELAEDPRSAPFPHAWRIFTFLAMFLAATAPYTNRFVHTLHADALALLFSVFTYWMVLRYLRAPTRWRLFMLAACPAVGFLIKQFLLIWGPLVFLILLLDQPKQIRRLVFFTVAAVLLFGATLGACYLLWGDSFIFYVFDVVGGQRKQIRLSPDGYHLSLVRSLNHLVMGWMELAIGVFGGWLMLRGRNIRRLGPLWVAWLALILTEALTSGVGWHVLYHFGPGVVIGMIWLFAALPRVWPVSKLPEDREFPTLLYFVRNVIAVAGVVTVYIALSVVPTGSKTEPRAWPGRHPSPDVYRYIAEIEEEFKGMPIESVLLDVGNWIYLRHSFLAKDRATAVADQPPVGIYDNINRFVERIQSRAYDKILVRNLHAPNFLYDWYDWQKSSGVRDALLNHYEEVRVIAAAEGENHLLPGIAFTGPVSVLVPKSH